MTKEELIQFLAPFSDDVQVLILDQNQGIQTFDIGYEVRKHPYTLTNSTILLERGEGFIILKAQEERKEND